MPKPKDTPWRSFAPKVCPVVSLYSFHSLACCILSELGRESKREREQKRESKREIERAKEREREREREKTYVAGTIISSFGCQQLVSESPLERITKCPIASGISVSSPYILSTSLGATAHLPPSLTISHTNFKSLPFCFSI